MVKYVKTEQGYVDASIFAPAQFKPEGKSYLTFSSPNNFTLEVNNRTKNWDGILEYFAYDKTWTVWDGTTILSAYNNDSEYVLYLRGTGNTKITGGGINKEWIITGTDIKCIGNIENLLDYATVASGKHPTMAKFCYSQMFSGCISLTQAPELLATTLANDCYLQMFSGCISLTQAPELLATTLATSCYFSMFSNCTALTQAPTLPATTLEANCYNNMFYGCTSLTQAPALPATTLTEGCYGGMFSGCTALTQAPDLPATTLENACYRSMFQGCTSLKLSSTKTGEYTQEYRIPSSGTGTISGYDLIDMFKYTGGTFTGTPAINTTYYLSTDNMIVRDTEVATLNGYVGSMIDNSVSNPLNITGATVGQIAKITAVDESGKPTSWEAVDVQTSLDKADTAISYDSQTLTDAQKQQARTNIGAADENLGCNKYNIHVTTTSGTTKDFTYYTNIGEIRQPTEAVDSSIRTAFLSLTLWPDATSISENLAKTLSKQYKILYDANYIDSPCRIIKSPLESGDNVLLSYNSSDNTVQVTGSKKNGFYNLIYDVANDALTYFYVDNDIRAVNGVVDQLVMSAAPTEDMHIATKQYVDIAKTEAQQLGLTAATPGQIIKVKAVQDGKPTEWEAVDMPSGGVEWYEVIDMETTENVNDLIISTDKNGRPISGYHALAMVLCFMIPADSTQTSTSGKVWVYPIASDLPPNTIRTITDITSWKTVSRTYSYLYAGSNRAIFISSAFSATIFDTDYNNVFNGIKLHVHNAGDHLPAGTKVRCLVLSKGWTA